MPRFQVLLDDLEVGLHSVHADDVIGGFVEIHAVDAAGVTSHRAYFGFSEEDFAWPSWLARKIIFLPSVSLAPINSSFDSRLMAMMPVERGFENSVERRFFHGAAACVAMKTKLAFFLEVSARCDERGELPRLPENFTRLDIALPRVAAAASGNS